MAAHQASLSFTISRSLLKLMSIGLGLPSNHPILCSPFSSCPQFFSASGSFPVSGLFTSSGQSIGPPASASVLPMNIQGWFPLGWTGLISLLSKGSQESSPAPQFKNINSSVLSLLVQLSHPYMATGKNTALTIWTLVSKVMSLFFNKLSKFVIAFFPRSSFMAAVTICSDFEAQEDQICHCFLCFPIYLPWSNGTGWHICGFEFFF